ncbi:MAG: hypothetical protein ACQEQI_07940 [Bacillota bacterium]
MNKKLLLIVGLLGFMLIISGCQGRGSLRVLVYDQHDNLVDDVYVGVYTSDFEERIDFAYTMTGEAEFAGLKEGIYGIQLVTPQKVTKRMKVKIESQSQEYVKVTVNQKDR